MMHQANPADDRVTTSRLAGEAEVARVTPGALALARQITFVAAAVTIAFPVVWIAWLWPLRETLDRSGTPLGGDFPVFYVTARTAWRGGSDALYSLQAQYSQLHLLFPSLAPESALPFLYPPFVAAFLRPLGALDYGEAFVCFTLFSLLLWGMTIVALRHSLPIFASAWRQPATWWLIGSPLLWESLMGGQVAIWSCAVLSVAWACLSRDRIVMAGAVLALATYKPNVLLFVGLGLLVRYPRMLLGGVLVAPLLLAAGWIGGGVHAWSDYLTMLRSAEAQHFVASPPFEKYHGLLRSTPWLRDHLLVAPSILVGAFCAILIAVWWRRHRARADASLAVGLLIVIQALFNPYEPVYDLLPLTIAALLIADAIAARSRSEREPGWAARGALLLILAEPHLSQWLAGASGIQPFSLGLLIATAWIVRRRSAGESAQLGQRGG